MSNSVGQLQPVTSRSVADVAYHCYYGYRRTLSLLAQPSECGVAHDKASTVTGASF